MFVPSLNTAARKTFVTAIQRSYPVHISSNYVAVLVESAVTSTASFGIIPNNLSESEKKILKEVCVTRPYAPTLENLNF